MLFSDRCHSKIMISNNFVEIEINRYKTNYCLNIYDSDMQKTSVIYRTALLYIFFNSLRSWNKDTLLEVNYTY